MKNNWLQKISNSYLGQPSETALQWYAPTQIGDYSTIYQSKDIPWVFLGSASMEDIEQVQQMAGKPVCIRYDLTDANTNSLPVTSYKYRFPELPVWDDNAYNAVSKYFREAVNNLVNLIMSHRCPIYVHCTAGANRSVSILAAALSKITGKSIFDVLREIKNQRGLASPHDAYVMMALDSSDNPQDLQIKPTVQQKLNLKN